MDVVHTWFPEGGKHVGQLTNANTTMFRIIGRVISLDTKCADTGSKVKIFVTNYAIMYYILNYFHPNTRHKLTGKLK
jgi:hypothetical protein